MPTHPGLKLWLHREYGIASPARISVQRAGSGAPGIVTFFAAPGKFHLPARKKPRSPPTRPTRTQMGTTATIPTSAIRAGSGISANHTRERPCNERHSRQLSGGKDGPRNSLKDREQKSFPLYHRLSQVGLAGSMLPELARSRCDSSPYTLRVRRKTPCSRIRSSVALTSAPASAGFALSGEFSRHEEASVWRRKGWLHPADPRGWFQWYCRYYRGRRLPDEDAR